MSSKKSAMSEEHKKALARGRDLSSVVRDCLERPSLSRAWTIVGRCRTSTKAIASMSWRAERDRDDPDRVDHGHRGRGRSLARDDRLFAHRRRWKCCPAPGPRPRRPPTGHGSRRARRHRDRHMGRMARRDVPPRGDPVTPSPRDRNAVGHRRRTATAGERSTTAAHDRRRRRHGGAGVLDGDRIRTE